MEASTIAAQHDAMMTMLEVVFNVDDRDVRLCAVLNLVQTADRCGLWQHGLPRSALDDYGYRHDLRPDLGRIVETLLRGFVQFVLVILNKGDTGLEEAFEIKCNRRSVTCEIDGLCELAFVDADVPDDEVAALPGLKEITAQIEPWAAATLSKNEADALADKHVQPGPNGEPIDMGLLMRGIDEADKRRKG